MLLHIVIVDLHHFSFFSLKQIIQVFPFSFIFCRDMKNDGKTFLVLLRETISRMSCDFVCFVCANDKLSLG